MIQLHTEFVFRTQFSICLDFRIFSGYLFRNSRTRSMASKFFQFFGFSPVFSKENNIKLSIYKQWDPHGLGNCAYINGLATNKAAIRDDMFKIACFYDKNGKWQTILAVNTTPFMESMNMQKYCWIRLCVMQKNKGVPDM